MHIVLQHTQRHTPEEVSHMHVHVHTTYFKNISCESIGYNTKPALTGLNGADRLFG